MTDIKQKGDTGEAALNQWFKSQQLSYVAICQAKESFQPLFSNDVKRPDFLLLFESIGLIAVDAKNYKLNTGKYYTLPIETELKRSVAFERLFRLPLWYAYYDNDNSWYWISALKAVEVGKERGKGDGRFIAIKRDQFEHIKTADDLAKLYTHRLPSISKIAALPVGL